MKNVLLASVGALALCAAVSTSAMAASGTLSASYANLTNGGGDIFGVDGSLSGMFGGSWGGQVDGGYHNLNSGGGDIWNIGGSLFWANATSRLAAIVDYHDFGAGSNFTNYGAGAEFYAGPQFTVAIKGGGESGNGGASGGYVGAMAEWYAAPNFALSAQVDYLDASGSITAESVQAEWLFSNSMPLSVYGGYQHVDVGGSTAGDLFFVGLKVYMNGGGAMSLVDRQRNGSMGYLTQSPLFLDQH